MRPSPAGVRFSIDDLSIETVAQILGGEASGHQVRAPGPGHGPDDRSLSLKIDHEAPDGFVAHSFAGDDPIECKTYVVKKLGLTLGNGVNRPMPQRKKIKKIVAT
jgi:hypothetical protein